MKTQHSHKIQQNKINTEHCGIVKINKTNTIIYYKLNTELFITKNNLIMFTQFLYYWKCIVHKLWYNFI